MDYNQEISRVPILKTCPECNTQYEDHVETCLIDGSELNSAPVPKAPAPVPPVAGSTAKAGVGVLLLLGGGLLLFLLGSVAALALMPSAPSTGPTDVANTATPQPEPEPEPEPEQLDPVQVGFTSDPPGAEVKEGDATRCITPCTIDHHPASLLPRTFMLSLDGYQDAEVIMNSTAVPQFTKLARIKTARPRPRPTAPSPSPTPTPKPRGSAPSIGTQR